MNRIGIYALFFSISLNLFAMQNQGSQLHQAVLANDLEAVKKLKESGVNLDEKDSKGQTAFDCAVKNKACKKIAAYLYPFYYELEELENKIGYKFKNVEKLIKAFTTREFCPKRNYQTYEWFGDAVLHLVLTVILDNQGYDGAQEGKLTQARAALEQKETLAELSEWLGFGKYIIKSQKSITTIDKLEDVLEAVIAAIYKDGGLIPAQNFIQKYWAPMLKNNGKVPASPIKILAKWKQSTKKECKEFREQPNDLVQCRLVHGDFEIIESCNKQLGNLATTQRMTSYRAARAFIEALPNEYAEYKEMLLISPFSEEYKIDLTGSHSNYKQMRTKSSYKCCL